MGITPQRYDLMSSTSKRILRLEYIKEQKNKCQFCGESLDGLPSKLVRDTKINQRLFPLGFFEYPIHLHHDHNTHLTIGAVHSRCNAFLFEHLGE